MEVLKCWIRWEGRGFCNKNIQLTKHLIILGMKDESKYPYIVYICVEDCNLVSHSISKHITSCYRNEHDDNSLKPERIVTLL